MTRFDGPVWSATGRGGPGGEDLPLVLVHGYLGGSEQWVDIEAAFRDRVQIICIDLPGFGRASAQAAPTSIRGFADCVIAELDRRGVDRFMLLGHSMGGMIAQEMAARIPTRVHRMVLYGTGPLGKMPDRFEPLSVSLDRLHTEGVAKTAERIAQTWFVQGRNHKAFPALAMIGEQASEAAARSSLLAMADWDGRSALPRLTMPTLIIWGDRDRSYRWPQIEYTWTHLPDVSLAVIPDASHAAHLERPKLFNVLLEDFLLGAGQEQKT